MNDALAQNRPSRRYRRRILLVWGCAIVLVGTVPGTWLALECQQASRQRTAVQECRSAGGEVGYERNAD